MSLKRYLPYLLIIFIFGMALNLNQLIPVEASVLAQQPTVDIPTVTGTPTGIMVIVRSGQEEFINIRSGPGIFYPKVGVLLVGQKTPAKGRSVGGDWILIEYQGVQGNQAWVYAPFVDLTPGTLPIVEPPPTPTPMQTSTIDPTLAAQFIVTSVPTRLPTYTLPPPLEIPTYSAEGTSSGPGNIPMGMVIFALAAIGILTGLFSLAQRR